MLNTVVLGYTKNPCLTIENQSKYGDTISAAVHGFISQYLQPSETSVIESSVMSNAPTLINSIFELTERLRPSVKMAAETTRKRLLNYYNNLHELL